MEITFIEDKKGSATLEIKGVSHGFCNALKDVLAQDKSVKLATYRIDHPLVGVPRMKIEATDAKAALKKAMKALDKDVETFGKEAKKIK